jgi:WD40 repeat protein
MACLFLIAGNLASTTFAGVANRPSSLYQQIGTLEADFLHWGPQSAVPHPMTEDIIVTSNTDGYVVAWDLGTLRPLWNTRVDQDDDVFLLTFSADGTRVFGASRKNNFYTFNAQTGQVASIAAQPSSVTAMAASASGAYLALGYMDTSVKVIDIETGKVVFEVAGDQTHFGFGVDALVFSSDNRSLLVGRDDIVEVFGFPAGSPYRRIVLKNWIRNLVITPDTEFIAVAGRQDNVIEVLDFEKQIPVFLLTGHTDYVISIRFSRDYTKLLSASWDKTVQVWDLATGKSMDIMTLPIEPFCLSHEAIACSIWLFFR